ncbi:TPA: hypothetical protein MD920_002406 [Klebsiella pneumoniae]|uniref:hypothetical protein n=1 Tax=Enterobacteriaceae TaxID=543 RepID=UPI00063AADE0|nr:MULTISPECIES: hypothetical protein [Enterobacteriaceae]HCD1344240.1 hypothetical protein [Klebsiella pneumoniae subsp. pneumoniae]HCJ7376436.1 hypothetical protein [Enterobacter hormaechei subsp. xiangfangensis]EKV5856910.1 hypothetical protein [Klebsiella pneumoniae]EKV5859348.1 hypothetical protein [Klebsiella pneumoniae]KLG10676.1 hypothetical protein YA49_09800 [Enterobacter cloacae subsp. cloacae]
MSRTDEEIKQATAIFAVYKAEIDKRELSNTDNYDKNILTLSSAGLAISLTLLKDIVSKEGPTLVAFLYLSWTFFGLAILSTIASFLISNKALTKQLSIAERYYIDGDQNAFSEKNRWGNFTSLLNWLSGSFFILAIISVIVFGLSNFSKRSQVDTENSKKCVVSNLNEGQVVPRMQQLPIDKGAVIPAMPKVPAPNPSPVNPVVLPNSPAAPTTTKP